MTTLLAPYAAGMLLAQGFNSFSQRICYHDSVVRWDGSQPENSVVDVKSLPQVSRDVLSKAHRVRPETSAQENPESPRNVTWTMKLVDQISDVVDAVGISGMAAIWHPGLYFDTGTFLASDLNYIIQVKVVTKEISDDKLTKFNPHQGKLYNWRFTDIYGDAFISGFLEGGEFTAIVSANASDDNERSSLKARHGINRRDTDFLEILNSLVALKNIRPTISVFYPPGGLQIPSHTDGWTLDSLTEAVRAFPKKVTVAPRQTRAILKPYKFLPSFPEPDLRYPGIDYPSANQYMREMINDYFDYQRTLHRILNAIHDVQYRGYSIDFGHGNDRLRQHSQRVLQVASKSKKNMDKVHQRRVEQVKEMRGRYIDDAPPPIRPNDPFPPTLWGLETARAACIRQMFWVERRVEDSEDHPEWMHSHRLYDYVDPAFFNILLPVLIPPPAAFNPNGHDELPTEDRWSLIPDHNSDTVYPIISTAIWGSHTITSPSVLDRVMDYAITQEIFTLDNEFFGLDPFFGRGKWAAIAYKFGDDGPMRFLIGMEGASKILLDETVPVVETTFAISRKVSTEKSCRTSSLQFYLIVYGGRILEDEDALRRFVKYANTHETFTVSNYIFGGDPAYGTKKWCFIAYKSGGDNEMRYLVGWEGERRSLAGKKS